MRRNFLTGCRELVSENILKIPFLVGPLFLALSVHGAAQQPGKVFQLGFLTGDSPSIMSARVEVLRQGLRELGYIEGKNVAIEYRYADGKIDRLPNLASELIDLKVDLIVAAGNEATAAAKNVTKEIPIVMTSISDAVRQGFIASLARPGGNITGLLGNPVGLYGKRLELLKEVVPKVNRVAILSNPQGPQSDADYKETQAAAQTLALKLQLLEVRTPADLDEAFRAATSGRADAMMVLSGAFVNSHQKQIAELALKSRLAAVSNNADAGFLLSYQTNRLEPYRRVATYVDKILKGAKPADLPVEQPTRFELIINLKTAKALNLRIPQSVLYRADKVIK